jgi:large subunit ribosomal protein L35
MPKGPKMKTHKGAQKRFDTTGTGKIRRAKGMKSHFRRRKSPRVKRMFDKLIEMSPADRKRVQKLIPYGLK